MATITKDLAKLITKKVIKNHIKHLKRELKELQVALED